jgi:predicted MFS family arabinose efflux permease
MSAGSHQLRTVLREPGFRRIVSARLAGSLGDGCFQAGLASFALFSPEAAPSAAAIAGGFAILLLPFTLLGPVVGVLLDRWSRRRVLIVANLFRASMLAVLAAMLHYGLGGVVFIGLALVALAANRLILAALSASLPHVLRSELLVPGNGLAPTLGTVAYVIGTGVGTLARGVPSLVVAAVLYAAAASVSRALPWLGPDVSAVDRSAREELRKVVSAIADARHHLNRRAVTALGTITALRLPVGVLIVMTLLIERAEEDAGGSALSGLSVILAASGLGFAAAALVTPQVVSRFGLPRTVALQLTSAALATLIAIPLTQAALAATAFFVAWATQGVKICVDTAVQREVADIYRGRVFTLYDIMFNCGFVAATVIAALVLPAGGGSIKALLVMVVSYVVIAVVSRPGWVDSREHPLSAV